MKFIFYISFLLFIFTLACDRVEYTDEPLEHHSYIWNRKASDSQAENIRYCHNFLDGFSILASEVNWNKNKAIVKNIELPKEKFGINSISIRINDFPGKIDSQEEAILEITQKALKRFEDNGFEIDEIQIDFDCSSSKLENYAKLLNSLNKHFTKKLSITALPSWLKQGSFAEVIQNCDSYILQLHSLTLPKNINIISPLFDSEKALKWVKQAAKLEKDFSVSLPTYGYFLGFDENGNYMGVSSEQGPKNWPHTKVLMTDINSVNDFIEAINIKHPKNLKSIFWFRLHNDADNLNWNSDAIRSLVMGNKVYSDSLEVIYSKQNESLTDIYLRNNSSIPVILNKGQSLNFTEDNIHFADTLQNFKLEELKSGAIKVILEKSIVVPPGKSVPACWIRKKNNLKDKS